jgi:hypothetical protein
VVRTIALAAAGVLIAAAAFELALSLGAWSIGSQPGDSAPGQAIVGPAALLAMLIGAVAAGVRAAKRERAVAVLAPSAGLFVTASEYTYDPYYAPSLRRFADGGAVPVWWIFALLAISSAVAALAWLRPRVGAQLTAFSLLAWFITQIFAGDGH